jgi:hypothetical protein
MAKTDILEEIEEKTQEKTQKFLLFPPGRRNIRSQHQSYHQYY